MKILLDTHAFLWWVTDDPRLSVAARAAIGDDANGVLVSAASAWEIAIKHPGPSRWRAGDHSRRLAERWRAGR